MAMRTATAVHRRRSGDSRPSPRRRGIAASVLWPEPAEVNPAGAGKAGADAPSAGAVGCGVDDLELELAAGVGEAADRAEDVAQSLRLQRPARARA